MYSIQNMWILLILPLIATIFILLPTGCFSYPKRRITLYLTLFSTILSLFLAMGSANYLVNHPNTVIESNILFINAGPLKLHLGVFLDNVSAFMLIILYTISATAAGFSYKYMDNKTPQKHDFSRYFVLLNLFIFSMTGLILSANLVQMYIFWELVGLFSYLLIGFNYKEPQAQRAARKTFLINRIGDFCLFSAVLGFLFFQIQDIDTFSYPLLSLNDVSSWGLLAYVQLGPLIYMILCLLIAIAACVKSAQIPFQVWLSDAMEGPTPISALIHGATMVSAGVFLLIRLYPALILSPVVLKTIAVIGISTAIISALIAIAQSDIKKILAFSTSSQLGLMFTAIGCGAYAGCVLHLGLHGITKAMMFLVAGIIIDKTLTRNLKFLGGLRDYMPIAAALWLLGAISLSGIFFSGFYSKEMIISHLYTSEQYLFLSMFIFTGILSIIYLFRSYFLIFEGTYKGVYDFSKDQDTPYDGINLYLLIPTGILAFMSMFFGGFVAQNFQRYIYILRQKFYLARHPELEISLFILSGIVIYIMWQIYGAKKFKIRKIRAVYRFVVLQFYINRMFENCYKIFIKGVSKIVKILDTYVISGLFEIASQTARFGGYLCMRLQNGNLNSYIFYSFLFITMVLLCATMIYFKGLLNYGG